MLVDSKVIKTKDAAVSFEPRESGGVVVRIEARVNADEAIELDLPTAIAFGRAIAKMAKAGAK